MFGVSSLPEETRPDDEKEKFESIKIPKNFVLSTWAICWISINMLVEIEIFLFTDLNIMKGVLLMSKDSWLLFNQMTIFVSS